LLQFGSRPCVNVTYYSCIVKLASSESLIVWCLYVVRCCRLLQIARVGLLPPVDLPMRLFLSRLMCSLSPPPLMMHFSGLYSGGPRPNCPLKSRGRYRHARRFRSNKGPTTLPKWGLPQSRMLASIARHFLGCGSSMACCNVYKKAELTPGLARDRAATWRVTMN